MISESEIMDQWTVISDCITKPEESFQAIEILTVEMFSEPGCRDVFKALQSLHAEELPSDINHVLARLEYMRKLTPDIGCELHRAALQERVATPIRYYANRVLQQYRKRRLREVLLNNCQQLQNGTEFSEALSDLQEDLALFGEDSNLDQSPQNRQQADDSYTPFPVDALPVVVRSFVDSVSRSVGCDPAFVMMPVLAACAAAIGNTRRLRMKNGWLVPPILWCVVIGESGSQKSPPMRAVMKFLKRRQQDQSVAFASAMRQFKTHEREYRKAIRKPDPADTTEMPTEPTRPIAERCIVSDVTLEGLVPILRDNWRGVLLVRDELVGWIGSFDRYAGRGTASADTAHWLSIYNAESIVVDRKTGDTPSVFVPDASVSVCGGIQPGILNRALNAEHRENGLLARLLFAYPPRQAKEWRDDEIPLADEDAFSKLLSGLFALGADTGADGSPKPANVWLHDDALQIFKNYVNTNGEEQAGLTGDLAAAWSKLEETPARLALIVHCIRQVCGDPISPWVCDAESMQTGVTLATWFKNETERVYKVLSESAGQRRLRQIAEWIRQRGGRVRSREVVAGRRDVANSNDADELLATLVSIGFGRWENVRGERGPGTREFVLFT
jgi:hypothetical protein